MQILMHSEGLTIVTCYLRLSFYTHCSEIHLLKQKPYRKYIKEIPYSMNLSDTIPQLLHMRQICP